MKPTLNELRPEMIKAIKPYHKNIDASNFSDQRLLAYCHPIDRDRFNERMGIVVDRMINN